MREGRRRDGRGGASLREAQQVTFCPPQGETLSPTNAGLWRACCPFRSSVILRSRGPRVGKPSEDPLSDPRPALPCPGQTRPGPWDPGDGGTGSPHIREERVSLFTRPALGRPPEANTRVRPQ